MKFQHHLPAAPLQPFLQGYVEADCRNSFENSVHTMFPNGLSGIFFNFGNSGKLFLQQEFNVAPVSVYGQIDRHFTIAHAPGFYSLGVLFKPTMLSKYLRVDMSEFTNNAIDGRLLRKDLIEVHEILQDSPDTRCKIDVLNRYFFNVLTKTPMNEAIGDHAVHLINTEENLLIETLASRLRISQRYLEMNFKKQVGITPKTYSLIQRFMRTERKLAAASLGNGICFGDEYYDQVHFIKDFKRFTGFTPARYKLQNLEMGKSFLVRP